MCVCHSGGLLAVVPPAKPEPLQNAPVPLCVYVWFGSAGQVWWFLGLRAEVPQGGHVQSYQRHQLPKAMELLRPSPALYDPQREIPALTQANPKCQVWSFREGRNKTCF